MKKKNWFSLVEDNFNSRAQVQPDSRDLQFTLTVPRFVVGADRFNLRVNLDQLMKSSNIYPFARARVPMRIVKSPSTEFPALFSRFN